MDYYSAYDSPLGSLLLVSDGTALTGLYMNREIPAELHDLPVFTLAKNWLADYFHGVVRQMDVPVQTRGTDFQEQIWKILRRIPWGETRTYGSIAEEVADLLGKEKMSAQAVGQAIGRNPVSILIPCHRVVGTSGKLTGYAGGMSNKQWLLNHEKQISKE